MIKTKGAREITQRKCAELIPYENNPRENDKAVDAVAASIREFGFNVPIVIDKDDIIVAGHTRLKAAEKLGLEDVPTIKVGDLTDEEVRAFRLADNKTAELAGWDFAMLDTDLTMKQAIIWVKNHFVFGRQDYHWQHEPCLYGWKEGAAHYFIDDRTYTTVIEDSRPDINKMSKAEMQALLEDIYSDKVSTTVLHEKKPSASELHPTMKPVPLIARLIKNSSRPGETVLDTFGGSGTTLVACEQLGRRCQMMELDPHYADVIIDRWEKFTGKKAKKKQNT